MEGPVLLCRGSRGYRTARGQKGTLPARLELLCPSQVWPLCRRKCLCNQQRRARNPSSVDAGGGLRGSNTTCYPPGNEVSRKGAEAAAPGAAGGALPVPHPPTSIRRLSLGAGRDSCSFPPCRSLERWIRVTRHRGCWGALPGRWARGRGRGRPAEQELPGHRLCSAEDSSVLTRPYVLPEPAAACRSLARAFMAFIKSVSFQRAVRPQ